MPERRDLLFGRRKGRPLSPVRRALMATELPRLLVDTATPPTARLSGLFPHAPERIRVEIGFGGGEHLMARALAEPNAGFIGIEPFVEGIAKVVATVAGGRIANIRLFGGEASVLLDWLPTASVDSVDILYPDPWPKKRHWKRRFMSIENLDRLGRVLRPGGTLRFASDIPSYVAWTLALLVRRPDFEWTAERVSDWTSPFPGWPGTRYETKALKAGRTPTYLAFKRM